MVLSKRSRAYSLLGALLALLVSGCASVPTGPGVRSQDTSTDAVDEAVGVQELRREVAELRNQVELQGNELESLRERQRQLYDDLDYRLRQSEGGGAARQQQGYGQAQSQTQGQAQGQAQGQTRTSTQGDTGGGQAASGQQQGAGDQDVYGQQGVAQQGQSASQQSASQQQQQTQTAAAQQSPEPGQQQGTSQMNVASADEQAAYDSAFELLKQSRYNDAIIEFGNMISQFPNGALVDDAQYWIGEAYYVTRDFESALQAFQAVVNRYPDSQRVPEALLKLGYVQAELGRTAEARQTLNQVISQYPGSRVAISAETRLSKIR